MTGPKGKPSILPPPVHFSKEIEEAIRKAREDKRHSELVGGLIITAVLFAVATLISLVGIGAHYGIALFLLMGGCVVWGFVAGRMVERGRKDE